MPRTLFESFWEHFEKNPDNNFVMPTKTSTKTACKNCAVKDCWILRGANHYQKSVQDLKDYKSFFFKDL